MSNAPLRVALVRDGDRPLDHWVGRLAERICASGELDIVGLIKRSDSSSSTTSSRLHRMWWSLEEKVVAKPVERNTPLFDAIQSSLPEPDLGDTAGISALDADIIIDVSRGLGRGLIAEAATKGVWFLNFLTPATGSESVQAIARNAPFYEAKLCRRREGTDQFETVSSAVLNLKLFATLNHLFLCEKSVSLIIRELKREAHGQADVAEQLQSDPQPSRPGVIMFTRYAFGFMGRAIKRFIEVQASKLHFRPGEFFLKTSRTDLLKADPSKMREHHSPVNGYFADPFLWERDGEMYCFFEVYNYSTDTGHISVGRFVDGQLTDIKPAIQTDYHMSFPFLFEDDEGSLFMMPEACSQRRIETWKCVEFPHKWERVQTVLDDVIAADSSLARIGQEWWLFTNMSNDPFGEMSSELHIYKIDGPGMSELTPHPLNPVVFDTRTARNGGRVILSNGDYYRISQDNSHGLYGYGVNAMKIEHISMTDYRETLTRKIEPNFQQGIIGSHHMDSRAGMVVMDVRKRVGGFRLRSSQ